MSEPEKPEASKPEADKPEADKPEADKRDPDKIYFNYQASGGKTKSFCVPKNAIGINSCIINRNQGTFSLVFIKGILMSGELQGVGHVSFDPVAAKQILQALAEHVEAYEKAHGVVSLTQAEKTPDWKTN